MRDELRRTHDLICESAGPCEYFRPPFGMTSVVVSRVLKEFAYTQVLWDVNTFDWKLTEGGAWVGFGMAQVAQLENGVVLLHDVHKSTVDHLGDFIRRMKDIPGCRLRLPNTHPSPSDPSIGSWWDRGRGQVWPIV